ncbi:MAG: patatin-like phospholipase family protein [Microcoleus sp. PH2017_10_PVI_O_A]|uniref:patatin-like phospholipase family protein n=1 Tax=unclassified Microcoleus TaxID=2642155 RepID=UPI001E1AAF6A|nr:MULTISPECIES: patatin-like phospholipase family protein [unclassified Microcoleus]TAE73496.1 MAG: phospholipase [Oscillatoriales cyanobacterium]MCC3409301.1 patatin-like phospholipase family protein [Microcoleus sp. PH2017_10_PVI_O_A]MCC3464040.1 patatin-like phospholipase family protein [Microcoleus sp. PH2017_11_PCY_U_A]MCC3480447.1 patatin-like phospholipase family protein [Microcoleus sp. PH2017_12_PCY_D_A]MCC3530263.1 patatin-like phospholipase family protein [Microcoleus sp. PH2017_21
MSKLYPQQILQEPGIRMSATEKETILKKFPPPDEKKQIYADAIFEGGGVRGLAFLGALRCCHDLGLRWRKLAGTSAGAITAAVLATDLSMDDLEELLGDLDYSIFLSQKNSPLILNGDPADDLQSPAWTLLFLTISRQMGEYSAQPFRQWLEATLGKGHLHTFADVKELTKDRELKVVISNLTRGEMLVIPDDLRRQDSADSDPLYQQLGLQNPEDFSVAEAVRLSMSIPLFFEPGKLGNDLIVDGGILSNFPLWIYDKQSVGSTPVVPRWFTFGFRLVDTGIENQVKIDTPLSMLAGMFRTMMKARDRYHQREMDKGRVINIDVTEAGVTTTDFNLDGDRKAKLYRLGYLSTKRFFLSSNFSWEKHLKARGFGE